MASLVNFAAKTWISRAVQLSLKPRYTQLFSQNSNALFINQSRFKSVESSALKTEEYVKDIILFRHEKPIFFFTMNLFSIMQFVLWSFLGVNILSLKDVPLPETPNPALSEVPFWRKVNLGEKKYKITLSVASFLIGYSVLAACWMFTLRSVRILVLRKNGLDLSIGTYAPFTQVRYIQVPLNHVSAFGSRLDGRSQIPFRVKGRMFYYLIDTTRGILTRPELFDKTVGVNRKLP